MKYGLSLTQLHQVDFAKLEELTLAAIADYYTNYMYWGTI